jgi:hypothetical protein
LQEKKSSTGNLTLMGESGAGPEFCWTMQLDRRVAYTTVCVIAASLSEDSLTTGSKWWQVIETVVLKAE